MNPNTTAFEGDELDGLISKVTLISELLRDAGDDVQGIFLRRLEGAREGIMNARSGVGAKGSPRPRASESRLRLVRSAPEQRPPSADASRRQPKRRAG
jgi:hypothetical protein